MKLLKYLANLGYGSRREVTQLLADKRVTRAGGEILDADSDFSHEDLRVDDEPLDPAPGCVIMLHKPVGYVCSTLDRSPLVYELLPERFTKRSPVVASVGRLDADTSGLLVLTDDGALNHRLTSPRRHVAKTYEATLATAIRGDEAEVFASGTLMLERETTPLKPAVLDVVDRQFVRITVTEGRYHQVRRMFAAVGNHVESLHRVAIGELFLGTLAQGEWRLLDNDARALLAAQAPLSATSTLNR